MDLLREVIFEQNKDLFQEELKSISYVELKPNVLVGEKEYSENYFKKIDEIENFILDGKKLEIIAKENNLNIKKRNKKDYKKNNFIEDKLFTKFFEIKNIKAPEVIEYKNKYYVAQVSSINKITRDITDEKVKEAIISQIKLKNIVENNIKISKEISAGSFNESKMREYAKDKKINIENIQIKSIKDNKIFNKDIVREIFKMSDKKINLITDSTLSKNYIVYINSTKKILLEKNSDDYDKYKSQARLGLAREIYKIYDKSVNNKYKIDINNRAIEKMIYKCNLNEKYIQLPIEKNHEFNTYHTFVIQTERRDELKNYLFSKGIETSIHYPIPIHMQPASKILNYKKGDFPITEKQSENILTLPIHQYLEDHEIQYISQNLNEFYKSNAHRN